MLIDEPFGGAGVGHAYFKHGATKLNFSRRALTQRHYGANATGAVAAERGR